MMKKIPVIARLPLVLLFIYLLIDTLNIYSLIFFIPITTYIIYDDYRRKTPGEAGIDPYLLNRLTSYYGTDWSNDVNNKGLRRKQWAEVLNKYVHSL